MTPPPELPERLNIADWLLDARGREGRGERQAARSATGGGVHLKQIIVVGEPATTRAVDGASPELETFPTHRDDAAIWLFSGGTTGKPKAVVQSHGSFANTTVCYGQGVLGLTERDVTLAVPKLFFGYATGSNLFFPFSVGAASALFPEKSTAETLFAKIRKFRPTVLVNVPTMTRTVGRNLRIDRKSTRLNSSH